MSEDISDGSLSSQGNHLRVPAVTWPLAVEDGHWQTHIRGSGGEDVVKGVDLRPRVKHGALVTRAGGCTLTEFAVLPPPQG